MALQTTCASERSKRASPSLRKRDSRELGIRSARLEIPRYGFVRRHLPSFHPMSMATTLKPPAVPHHQMVRPIGRGSYGEIWLARSLTGAWRAVKIVDRSRFDDQRSFEREFDGMARFEPVSREHEGFVDILHVGRSDDGGCFYYVVGLADDAVSRGTFDP